MKIVLEQHSPDYKTIRYPGGEMQLRLTDDCITRLTKHAEGPYEVDLVARMRSPEHLLALGLMNSAIRGVDPRLHVHCHLPYLPYARADRCFVPGDCFGLETFAQMINAMEFESVITLDVHSDVAEAKIHNLVNRKAGFYIARAIERFASSHGNDINVMFPDEGARERYVRHQIWVGNVLTTVINASKKRDPASGVLTGFTVPPIDKPTLIVDDICDGGGTFLGIADAADTEHPLGLYVTHGIFSKGFTSLLDRFRHIYCTDSFSTLEPTPHVTQFQISIP